MSEEINTGMGQHFGKYAGLISRQEKFNMALVSVCLTLSYSQQQLSLAKYS